MPIEIKLPKLDKDMEEGKIVGCLVKVGDRVKKGDVIYEVETDKTTLEVQSPVDGFVENILVDIGQRLLVGDSVMVLGDKGQKLPAASGKPQMPPIDSEHKLGQTFPLNRIQKIIAQRMLQSKLEIPCFYLTVSQLACGW